MNNQLIQGLSLISNIIIIGVMLLMDGSFIYVFRKSEGHPDRRFMAGMGIVVNIIGTIVVGLMLFGVIL